MEHCPTWINKSEIAETFFWTKKIKFKQLQQFKKFSNVSNNVDNEETYDNWRFPETWHKVQLILGTLIFQSYGNSLTTALQISVGT